MKDESQISRQARWQRKHRALGLCVLCSEPAFKGWRCKKHYEQHKITMRLRYIPKVRGRYRVKSAALSQEAEDRRGPQAKKKTAKKAAGRRTKRRSADAPRTEAARKAVAQKASAAKKKRPRVTSRKTTTRPATKAAKRATTVRRALAAVVKSEKGSGQKTGASKKGVPRRSAPRPRAPAGKHSAR